MVIIVLPGLDGSHPSLEIFQKQFNGIECRILDYPSYLGTYAELTDHIVKEIRGYRACVLIGQSFGGPLALMAAERLQNVHGVYLVSYPLKINVEERLLSVMPLPEIFLRPSKRSFQGLNIGNLIIMGLNPDLLMALGPELDNSLDKIPEKVIVERVKSVLTYQVDKKLLARVVRSIIIGTDDPLCDSPKSLLKNTSVPLTFIEGPHMLLETRPQMCSNAVYRNLL